jgi:uncharacterized membrane protein
MTNKSIVDQIAWTVALLLSGVAAGMFLMDFFGYYPLLQRLPAHAAIQLHQEAVPLHRGIFQLAILGSGAACVILISFFSVGMSRWLLIASLVCLVVLIVYTNLALIPLNREIGTWVPGAPPVEWKERFADVIFLEQLRGFLPALAFALDLLASLRARPRIKMVRVGPDAPDHSVVVATPSL